MISFPHSFILQEPKPRRAKNLLKEMIPRRQIPHDLRVRASVGIFVDAFVVEAFVGAFVGDDVLILFWSHVGMAFVEENLGVLFRVFVAVVERALDGVLILFWSRLGIPSQRENV
jgi:hypothetical protein